MKMKNEKVKMKNEKVKMKNEKVRVKNEKVKMKNEKVKMKKYLILIVKKVPGTVLAILLLLGCSRSKEKTPEEVSAETANVEIIAAVFSEEAAQGPFEQEIIESAPVTPVDELKFVVIPPSARPGEPVIVAYTGDSAASGNLQAVLLDSRGRRLTKAAFFSIPGEEAGEAPQIMALKAAIMAVPSTALIGDASIRIESADGVVRELPFAIDEREFRSETIPLNQANTDLRTVPDPQKTAESNQLWAIISRTGSEIYSTEPFLPPVTSTRRTSAYGSRRVYEYADGKTDTTIHAGVDCGVPTGTEVMACAAGKVVLARARIVTGNTVILEHLPGLYSLYYHMDNIAVNEGDLVGAGAFLGESGSTGLATGPHLHWEIRVSTENADPDAFLSHPILDKNDIINKLMTNVE